jgi:hypothetical protein
MQEFVLELMLLRVLVKEFDHQCPNGIVITISVEYEWLPSGCNSCNVFGLLIGLY